jgi:hypothetical protein
MQQGWTTPSLLPPPPDSLQNGKTAWEWAWSTINSGSHFSSQQAPTLENTINNISNHLSPFKIAQLETICSVRALALYLYV